MAAHPDDVDFGLAGSVAAWVADGHEVSYCICTSGEAGEAPPEVPRGDVAALRERVVAAGVEPVPALNPYWERMGVTVLDPDGRRVVLAQLPG